MDPSSKLFPERIQPLSAIEQPRELFTLHADKRDDFRLVNFHQTEQNDGKTYRWSESVSMVRIRIAPVPVKVFIDTGCLRGATVPFPFSIYWNDYLVPRKAISVQQGVISFEIDTCFFESFGEQKLTISCKPLNAENGRRKLGMPICSIKVIESAPDTPKIPLEKYRPTLWWQNPLMLMRKNTSPLIPIWKVRIPDNTCFLSKTISSVVPPLSPQYDRTVVASWESNREIVKSLQTTFDDDDWRQMILIQSPESNDQYPIQTAVRHLLENHQGLSRQQIYDLAIQWFGGAPPKQAYVNPCFASDFIVAMALKDVFKTRVCIHIVEDRCLFGRSPFSETDREIVQEAIGKCDLLLVSSPEMRQAYEHQFGKVAYLFPPTVPQSLVANHRNDYSKSENQTNVSFWNRLRHWIPQSAKNASLDRPIERAILISEIPDRRSLERIRSTLRTSGLHVDWFVENPERIAELVTLETLQADGIHVRNIASEEEIVNELRNRSFVILPSGKLDGRDTEEAIARLNLPAKFIFAIATAHLPVIVLGSAETSVARFVSRFSLGSAADYDGKALQKAALEISRPERQKTIRQNAANIGKWFSNFGIRDWLWDSLEQGEPADRRFENLFPPEGGLDHYFDPIAPPEIHWAFKETWKVINRIKRNGFVPDAIIDVGASTGVWSWTASTIFPDSRFILIDPLLERYDANSRQFYHSSIRNCETHEVALTDHCGETEMLVSADLYTSSLLPIGLNAAENESVIVKLMTLNELATKRNIEGRTLLKIDVQFAEHLVLNGGRNFIRSNVDYIILELTINPTVHQARSYRQMLEMMDELGFEVIDEMQGWRDPKTGALEQKDTVFVRRERHPRFALQAQPLRRAA